MIENPASPAALRAAQLNAQTRVLATYANHQQQIMNLIQQCSTIATMDEQAAIAVFGAGNCHDIDLIQLATRFATIRLLDIDRAALVYGAAAQQAIRDQSGNSQPLPVVLIAPIDLASPLASVSTDAATSDANLRDIAESLQSPFSERPCPSSDVVVSACVLSQINSALLNLMNEQHPQFLMLLQSLRRGHFSRMLQLLKPGGHGIFVSDLVSSETTPAIKKVTDAELPQLLAHCLSTGNFFSGLNPGIILQDFQTWPEIASLCRDVRIHAPWRWQMGPRTYAVFAITFSRVPESLKG